MTRRDFLKKLALGSGLLVFGFEKGFAQQRSQGRAIPVQENNPAIQYHRQRCPRNCRHDCIGFCSKTTGVFELPAPQDGDSCVHCGQCTLFCPRGAITERFHYQDVDRAISSRDKIVIATIAPAIRVALG
jgi:NAD-dependent dihydropyrimidine dehydrogenase PreA subunit